MVPEGPMWLHEIKHDGFRVLVNERDDSVRLFTRRGFDWSDRYPRICEEDQRRVLAILALKASCQEGDLTRLA
jgi:ATP-dependent DNA ligase